MKNKKSNSPASKGSWLPKVLGWVVLLVLACFLVFIYFILPPKVGQSIADRAQIRKALTQTPKTDGFRYQDVSFTASDGVSLQGWWLPSAKKGKPEGTVILSHGVFKNREQVLSRAEFLAKAGYQVLLFDLRGCGESGNSPVSGGLLEAKDYLGAYDNLEKTRRLQSPVVFFGFSLGAIAALRAGQQEGDKIQAIIADSPLPNIKAYVSRRTMGGGFSVFPGFLGRCLKAYNALTGLSLTQEDLDLSPVVKQITQTPVLYIVGQKDDLARPPEVRQLFDLTAARHRRLDYIPDAGHDQTYSQYPVIYERGVLEFLNDLKTGFPEPKLSGAAN